VLHEELELASCIERWLSVLAVAFHG